MSLQSDPTALLLDDMSDGQWHPMTKIRQRNTKHFKGTKLDLLATVEDHVANGTFLAGANNSYRMTRSSLEMWRLQRGLSSAATTRDMNAPRFFGGILEDDGWEMAPLREMDVVHFHATEDAARQARALVGLNGMTLYNFEGLVRVFALDGSFAYDILKDAIQENPNLGISGIRIDHDVKRRELCDLPSSFVQDLCAFYGSFAHALLRQSMSSVRKHIAERDDIQQQIYLWIIDAIQRYDHTTSIPFAAYLHSAMNRWVHDLSRKSFGRAVADSELQLSRAKSDFQTLHNRKPNLEELAEFMGETVEKVRRKSQGVANVNNLRTASSLVVEDWELPIVSSENSTNRIEDETGQTLLAAALTTSAIEYKGGPNVVAWCNVYAKTWGDGVPERMTSSEKNAEKNLMLSMQTKLADVR